LHITVEIEYLYKHGNWKLVSNAIIGTAYSAIAAMPALIGIFHMGAILLHCEAITRAIFNTISAKGTIFQIK